MTHEDERMHILEQIERGEISAAEGLSLIQSLMEEERDDQSANPDQPIEASLPYEAGEAAHTPPESDGDQSEPSRQDGEPVVGEVFSHPSKSERSELPADVEKWRRWWILPLWAGVGVTVVGGSLMYAALQSGGIGFWFLCASLPFTIGLLLIVLAWQSRSSRWLHLRIQQRPGQSPQRIALSFPLPIRLTAWFFRTFRDRIPGLQNTSIDEVILALDQSANPENPLYIAVNGDEAGENVQIFIG